MTFFQVMLYPNKYFASEIRTSPEESSSSSIDKEKESLIKKPTSLDENEYIAAKKFISNSFSKKLIFF